MTLVRPEAEDGGVEAEGDGETVHAGLKAGAQVAATLPFAANALGGATYAEMERPVRDVHARGAAMAGRARTGVHQATGALVRHHLTEHRVAQETVDQASLERPPSLAYAMADPVEAVAPFQDPDGRPSRWMVGGVKVATVAIALAPRFEAAIMDAVPAEPRVRRRPDATGALEGAAARGGEAAGAHPIAVEATRRGGGASP